MGMQPLPGTIRAEDIKPIGNDFIQREYFPNGRLTDCSKQATSWGPDFCYQHAGACCISRDVLKQVQWKPNDKLVLATINKSKAEDYEFCMEVAFKFKKSVMLSPVLYEYRT
jgi:hypothetical protein